MYTCEPLRRYSAAISPRRPNRATECHSVRSWFSPDCLSFQFSVVARRRFATVMPEGMARVSGSAPRCPTRITLLTPRAMAAAVECLKEGAIVVLLGAASGKCFWRGSVYSGPSAHYALTAHAPAPAHPQA